MEEKNYIHQLKAENATLKNNKKAADMTISELRKKLSKAEHDRDRYRNRIDTLEKQVADMEERHNLLLTACQSMEKKKKDAEHRAEVAEMALLIACANAVKNEKDDVNIELLIQVLYDKYLKQAKKELAEEGKDG